MSSKKPRTEGTDPAFISAHHGAVASPTPAWVDLTKLYIRDPGKPDHSNWAGLDMTGEVPGLIVRWIPTKKGEWTAEVNFDIPFADGGRVKELRAQLVPDYALRPRAVDAPLLGRRHDRRSG